MLLTDGEPHHDSIGREFNVLDAQEAVQSGDVRHGREYVSRASVGRE